MASLSRKTQKVYASAGLSSPTGILAQFGSLKAGTIVWSSDPDIIQQLAAFEAGFSGATIDVGGEPVPARQDMDSLFHLAFRQLAYLLDRGIPEYDAGTEYGENSFCQVDGVIYRSLQDGNTDNTPADSPTYWALAVTNTNPVKAWVTFDGRTGTIDQQFNVASVTRNAAGLYTVNFITPMADIFYVVKGTVGSRPGVSTANGDDNYITTGRPGSTTTRSKTQCQVRCWDKTEGRGEDATLISLEFTGN